MATPVCRAFGTSFQDTIVPVDPHDLNKAIWASSRARMRRSERSAALYTGFSVLKTPVPGPTVVIARMRTPLFVTLALTLSSRSPAASARSMCATSLNR